MIPSGFGREFPNFGIPISEQQGLKPLSGFVPAMSLPLLRQNPVLDSTAFETSPLLFPDSSLEAYNHANPSGQTDSPTSQPPASANFRQQVVERLADGMGELVQNNDKLLLGDVKNLVMQKVSLANMVGTNHKNPGAQVRLLLSAFGDIEWYIGNVLSDFKGVQLPPEVQSFIATMRAMQAGIMAQIKQITGLKLSDDEMRALLEQDPNQTGQNISLNWLIQQDHQMKPQTNGPGITGNHTNPASDPNDIYGIRANPGKYQAALGGANRKVVAEMQNILQQAAALIQAAARDPQGGASKLLAAIAILNRGQAIHEVAQALDGFQPANKSNGSFSATSGVFERLIQQARDMMSQRGLPPDLLATSGGSFNSRPQ